MTDISTNSAGVSNAAIMQHLGKNVNYPTKYDPSVLVREPRANNRVAVGIDPENLPFKGHDVWHLWEMTCINSTTNEPEVGVFKVYYDCESKYIVESKSLKLYTFSFNNESYPNGLHDVCNIMAKDLAEKLETPVTVKMYPATYSREFTVNNEIPFDDMTEYINVDRDKEINANILNANITNGMFECDEIRLHTSLLRSLCRVTSQPDMGDCFLAMKLENPVNVIEAIKTFKNTVLSYRNQNHFHEESCEGIFKAMQDHYKNSIVELGVYCLYTRRGGIDINPFRYYSNDPDVAIAASDIGKNVLFKTVRQ